MHIIYFWFGILTIKTVDMAVKDFCTYVQYTKTRNYTECPNPSICNRTFHMAFVNKQPYLPGDMKIQEMLMRCCGKWAKIKQKIIEDISQLEDPTSVVHKAPDFIFPVLTRENEKRKYGYYNIPYLAVDTAWYITVDPKTTALTSILTLYPILVIVILMAIVSGFVTWILESKQNSKEFPREFFLGWFEGFWFSFITMTTVGYGDKAPKSVTGKLYTTVWILVGIVACGLVTATITNEISKANTPPPPTMIGKNIGIVKYHDFEGIYET